MCGHLIKPSDLVVIFLALHDSITPNKSAGVHAVGTALPQGRQPAAVFYPFAQPTPYAYESHYGIGMRGIKRVIVFISMVLKMSFGRVYLWPCQG
jgi:hypothetical protein